MKWILPPLNFSNTANNSGIIAAAVSFVQALRCLSWYLAHAGTLKLSRLSTISVRQCVSSINWGPHSKYAFSWTKKSFPSSFVCSESWITCTYEVLIQFRVKRSTFYLNILDFKAPYLPSKSGNLVWNWQISKKKTLSIVLMPIVFKVMPFDFEQIKTMDHYGEIALRCDN